MLESCYICLNLYTGDTCDDCYTLDLSMKHDIREMTCGECLGNCYKTIIDPTPMTDPFCPQCYGTGKVTVLFALKFGGRTRKTPDRRKKEKS